MRSTLDSTMGGETNLSPPPLEPETLRGEEQDWVSALGESVSFGRFLSQPLEWVPWRKS
uniref:Uncharacterized protein n=1 Tax=Aegilops tauschii subsp. strangulata TaxID=200361 RepID=A0A453KQ72_AEGTS